MVQRSRCRNEHRLHGRRIKVFSGRSTCLKEMGPIICLQGCRIEGNNYALYIISVECTTECKRYVWGR